MKMPATTAAGTQFGQNWASIVHGIGRQREGLKLDYDTQAPVGIDPADDRAAYRHGPYVADR